ncbi:MAG: aspartyl-tRNA(Asn)/glutamyl-tRNA(Gln) amidotransferase subunit, partial [Thermodesulfobacteriota bacterium]|nr:aspartyl-tRNA(Asn)/glutamyl-tRNA(Gln) amidotransferase subunit [Thermodesulfobacteriota bacterium]
MFESRRSAKEIVETKGLLQLSNEDELRVLVSKILQDSPQEVARYHAGKTQLLGHFVGQVMKATRGKANPGLVNKILSEELKRLAP